LTLNLGVLIVIAFYLSRVFGSIRDTWNPFGEGDRGFTVLFGIVSMGRYVCFAFEPGEH
jgi:hypothetical protein